MALISIDYGSVSGGGLDTFATLQLSTTDTELIGKSVDIQFEDGTTGYTINPITMNGTQSVKVQSYGNYSVLYNSDEVGSANVNSFTDYPMDLSIGTMLFNNGDQCTSLTGGWTLKKISGGSAPIVDTTIHSSGVSGWAGIYTSSLMNLTAYSKIVVEHNTDTGVVSGTNGLFMDFSSGISTAWTSNSLGSVSFTSGGSANGSLSIVSHTSTKTIIDISSISVPVSIGFGMYGDVPIQFSKIYAK